MSMLAEPRRKQKIINLRAKNNAWSNDANKFGQRMLEKMGWSSGKGLGAKENGIIEHVIAKYKNDDKGLGFEDKNDQWTKHEDDFNALLANLSNGKDEKKDVLHSGVSLEVKSKKSKARIHYHKFTRGKDLSKYSEKDLANIFGKKSFKEEVLDKNDKEEMISTEQVFTEKGSMEDYFKSKMGALKFKNKIGISDNQDSNKNQDFVFEGFSFTKEDDNNTVSEKKETFTFYNSENNKIQEITVNEYKQEKIPKKTKKKKSKTENVTDHEINENTDHVFEGFSCTNNSECTETSSYDTLNKETQELPTEEPVLTKKNKKKKKNKESADTHECTLENVDTKKTKKRKKDKTIEKIADCSQEKAQEEECGREETYVPKKKKKRKNKDL